MARNYPSYRVMFERLLNLLNLKESRFIGGKNPRMTRGLRMGVQSGMPGLRLQIEVYNGKGTGCSQVLYSCGQREFAEKVWAIEAGKDILRMVKR